MFENIKKKVIAQSQLREIRKQYQNNKIVFCTGCYDILQSGHAVFLTSVRAMEKF